MASLKPGLFLRSDTRKVIAGKSTDIDGYLLQGGPLLVINRVIAPINGLING